MGQLAGVIPFTQGIENEELRTSLPHAAPASLQSLPFTGSEPNGSDFQTHK